MLRDYLAPSLCILAGACVLVAAVCWSRLPPADPNWTPAKEELLMEHAKELQRLAREPDSPAVEDARQRAAAEYDDLLRQRNDALGGKAVLGMLLQMAGVGLGLVGSVWLILRQNQAEDRRSGSG